MIEIGKKLQQRRIELNLSYEDVSNMTKLSIPHLKAIEEGDLDYFKDDLTYVRFYVRSYCKALDVPYENFKDDVVDSIEDYTNTMAMKKQERKEQMEKAIAERTKPVKASNIVRKEVETLMKENKGPKLAKKDFASIQQNANKNKRFKNKKMDVSMMSLLAVLVGIVGIVIYVGVGSLFNGEETPKDPSIDNPPVVDKTPTPEVDADADVEKDPSNGDKESKKDVTITMETANSYIVSGIKVDDKVEIEVKFTDNQSWFDGAFNTAPIQNDRADKIYGPNESYTVDNKAGTNDVYELIFGYFPGTKILVNGSEVSIDPSLLTTGNVQTIYIHVRGE